MNPHIIKNSQFSAEVRAVRDFLVSLEAGAVATYETLNRLAGKDIRPGRPGYTVLIQAKRRAAKEAAVLTATLPNVGVRRLPSEEVATIDNDRERRLIGKRMRRASKRLKCANDTEISNEARTKKYAALATYGAMELFRANRQVTEQLAANNPGEVSLRKLLEAFK